MRGSVIDEVVNGYQLNSSGNTTNYTYHHDALESVLGQSGNTGTVVAAQGYTAFGSTVNATGSSNNTLKFTGREQDIETGLIYYRARYYDPIVTGRFLSEDPIRSGINFYTYDGNNPVNASDPSGLDAFLAAQPVINLAGYDVPAYHTAIVLIPNNPEDFSSQPGWTDLGGSSILSTLSAQPSTGFTAGTLFGQGNLISTPNWPNDQFQNLSQYVPIQTPNGMTDTQFINALINAAGSYNNSAQYFPSTVEQGGYNSNSFTSGVIKKAGGTPPAINYKAPGYSKPLQINSSSSNNAFVGTTNSAMDAVNAAIAPPAPTATLSVDLLGFRDAADGGFVIYPNMSNTNQIQSVYRKH